MSAAPQLQQTGHDLVITRLLDAPRDLVWKAWTDRDILKSWFCPKDFSVPECEFDLRPGGAWRAVMHAPSGTDYICIGHYQEIDPPHKLVFTHAWEDENGEPGHISLITVTFAEEGSKTRMRFEHIGFANAEARDNHDEGWSSAFENLNDALLKV